MDVTISIDRWLAGFAVQSQSGGRPHLEGLYPDYRQAKQCAEHLSNGQVFPGAWAPEVNGLAAYQKSRRNVADSAYFRRNVADSARQDFNAELYKTSIAIGRLKALAIAAKEKTSSNEQIVKRFVEIMEEFE